MASDFSKHLESMQVDGQQDVNNKAVNLLSIERVQKLDLLVHLIVNLQQPLILQGAPGVGKTTLLSAVESKKTSSTDMLLLNPAKQASFESIQSEIIEFIKRTRQLEYHSLVDVLEAHAQQELQLALLIDDAALLVSGLMTALIDYANKYQVLRLVFVLTPEEYKEKSHLEKIQTHCHFVELPALNIRQCEAFIRTLIEQETSLYTLKDIDISLVSEIYRETKGNPHQISAIIRAAKRRNFANIPVLVIMVGVVFICSVIVSVFLWQKPEQDKLSFTVKPVGSAVELIKQRPVMVMQQEIDGNILPELEVIEVPVETLLPTAVSALPLTEMQETLIIEESTTQTDSINQYTALNPQSDKEDDLASNSILVAQESKVDVIKIEPEKKGKDSVLVSDAQDDRLWVLTQNKRQYTLQLMVSMKKDKLLEEQEKYRRLGIETFYLEKKNKQLKNYVLFFGVFVSINEAKKEMQKLPKALQQSWPRTFSAIQKGL